MELNEFYRPSQEELGSGTRSPSETLYPSCWKDSAIAALINAGDRAAADRYNDDINAATNIDPVEALDFSYPRAQLRLVWPRSMVSNRSPF